MIVCGFAVWWTTASDTLAALGLLAVATGIGQIAVARGRRARAHEAPRDDRFRVEQLSL